MSLRHDLEPYPRFVAVVLVALFFVALVGMLCVLAGPTTTNPYLDNERVIPMSQDRRTDPTRTVKHHSPPPRHSPILRVAPDDRRAIDPNPKRMPDIKGRSIVPGVPDRQSSTGMSPAMVFMSVSTGLLFLFIAFIVGVVVGDSIKGGQLNRLEHGKSMVEAEMIHRTNHAAVIERQNGELLKLCEIIRKKKAEEPTPPESRPSCTSRTAPTPANQEVRIHWTMNGPGSG